MPSGLVVADDLTGACDTGHEFAARGYRTRVLVDGGDPGDADVLVVDTDSRYDPEDEAAAAVRGAVEAHPAPVVYKKVDSTLRGNLAAEVGAALAAVGERADAPGLAVVAPASPATGRTTAGGHHLVDGALVTDTDPGRDPEKGPASAHLPSLFADADAPVAHVGMGAVAAGADAVAGRLRDLPADPRIVTADATHESHLAAVAEGARRVDRPAVAVGSAGLAGHVSLPAEPTAPPVDPAPPDEARGVLGVVGSVAPETLAALAELPDRTVTVLDPERAVEDPGAAAERASQGARETLARDGRAVVTAATDRAAVDRALAAGENAGLSGRATRERVARALARTAASVVAERPPRGLFLTGGDTAVGVLDALDARAVDLSDEAVEAGIPLGAVAGGAADGAALVTKAGAFGGAETAVNCLDRLAEV